MKPGLEEALAQCLARLEAGASIEDCLRGRETLAAELRPLLQAAQALRDRDAIADYTLPAFERGRARMHAARIRQVEGGRRAPILPGWFFGRPAALMAVAAVVALVAALGFTTGLFRFDADTTSAQVEGVVSRVDPDAIVLMTADGQLIIRIGENTIFLDADGDVISGGDIVPGRGAKVEVEEEDGAFAGLRIEVEDDGDEGGSGAEVEFSAVIDTVSGSTLTVQASFGAATVRIDPQTEVKGALAAGASVEVHATLQPDGSYLAREIDVKGPEGGDDEGDGGDDDGDDRSGTSGSGDSGDDEPDNSGPGSSDSGSGDDGHDDEEEEKD